jgi:hypothetical protein
VYDDFFSGDRAWFRFALKSKDATTGGRLKRQLRSTGRGSKGAGGKSEIGAAQILDQKLTEANAKADVLIAQHRRTRAASKATDARAGLGANTKSATFDRMKKKWLVKKRSAQPMRNSWMMMLKTV